MDSHILLPMISTTISAIFAVMVFDQYLARRKPYQLVWTLGMVAYTGGTLMEFLGNTFGWTPVEYHLWYFFGADCTAALLGLGSLYLMMTRRTVAHGIAAVVTLGLVAAFLIVMSTPVKMDVLAQFVSQHLQVNIKAMQSPVILRVLTATLNITGASVLFGGAAYSAWSFWKSRQKKSRVISTVLIAIGAIAGSNTGWAGLNIDYGLFLAELTSVVFIFAGFLVSTEVFEQFRIPFTRMALGVQRKEK